MTDYFVSVDGFDSLIVRDALTPKIAAWRALTELKVDLEVCLLVLVKIKASISPKKEHRLVMYNNLGEVPNFSCSDLDDWWLDGTFEGWIAYQTKRADSMAEELSLKRKVLSAALKVSGVTE